METLERVIDHEDLRPRFEEVLDVLAFELWQRGSRQDLAADEDAANEDATVGCHASCL